MKKKSKPKELIWKVQRWVQHFFISDIARWVTWHDCKSPAHAKKMLAEIPGLVRVMHEGVDVTAKLVEEIKNENG